MRTPRNRWMEVALAAVPLLTTIELFSVADVAISRSVTTFLIFAMTYLGLQRVCSALVDIAVIGYRGSAASR